jgi:hypothetical protein
MGEGIAGLITHELGTLVNNDEHQGTCSLRSCSASS